MRRIGFIKKKNCYRLTLWGWAIIILVVMAMAFAFVRGIVPFLSSQHPAEARVMVVEGYLPDRSFEKVMGLFEEGNYDLLITTGPQFEQGFYATGILSSAGLVGKSLLAMGFDSTRLAIVPLPGYIYRDRTYHSAVFCKAYLQQHHPDVRHINLVSQSVHARRSRYLYRKAFGPQYEVGNIVIPTESINPTDWYKSSRGFRTVIDETIAYLYVILFFGP